MTSIRPFFVVASVAGRSSSFIGPWVFGVVAIETTQRLELSGLSGLAAEQQGLRMAILSILVFLVVGGLLLLWVNEPEPSPSKASPQTNEDFLADGKEHGQEE